MNITDFLSEKKPLAEDVLKEFEDHLKNFEASIDICGVEFEYNRKFCKALIEHHYREFDLKFLNQATTYQQGNIQLPKYAVSLLNTEQKSCIIDIGPYYLHINYGKMSDKSYYRSSKIPEILEYPLLSAMNSDNFRFELHDTGILQRYTITHISKEAKNFIAKNRKHLEFVSNFQTIINDEARKSIKDSLKYFDSSALFAIYEAKWVLRVFDNRGIEIKNKSIESDHIAKASFPIIGMINGKAYLMSYANPEKEKLGKMQYYLYDIEHERG